MKVSYKQVIDFVNSASNYLRIHPEKNKLQYALSKLIKRGASVYSEYSDKIEDSRIDNCEVDEKGVILHDDRGQFRFSKDGLKKFNKAQRDLAKEQVDFEPHILSEKDLPKDLEQSFRDDFEGFVISPAK